MGSGRVVAVEVLLRIAAEQPTAAVQQAKQAVLVFSVTVITV